jgi:hypothetical protein
MATQYDRDQQRELRRYDYIKSNPGGECRRLVVTSSMSSPLADNTPGRTLGGGHGMMSET